ncbi:cation/calcium exchanger 5-like isoform X1 [Andrographis paniculata]|uniref:cation/calcium exchanger 5-like isoform X1 n=1 Tax=Andrographis paniculata TaxID=175694 RepID=UPI0021E82ECB|nr:cation/calcium exchanger 5-like isoform X1 [Andrographis paniculata]XP_051124187.1 cation/calcium exchanger 5-like isoform X1 [Andrographis paniculata]
MAFNFIVFLLLVATIAFFLAIPRRPSIPQYPTPHRALLAESNCRLTSSDGLFDYSSFHSCLFAGNPFLSVPFLVLVLLFQFYILVKTAQDRFSVVVTKLSAHLKLSPSMGAVTLLALGNGAPDVFASVAAVRGGQPRTGFGAILSAGTFVSAFVVGFVAIYAAPFAVDPAPFIRDVLFYLTAALFLFYVYLSAEIYLWQAVGFVGFYVFFVGIVFSMDFGYRSVVGEEKRKGADGGAAGGGGGGGGGVGAEVVAMDCESGELVDRFNAGSKKSFGFWKVLNMISRTWEVPVSTLLKLTVPETSPSKWSRFYQSATIALCPLALLFSCKSFMPLDHSIIFLIPNTRFPLWSVVLFASSSLAVLHYMIEKEPPKSEQISAAVIAFIMSVFWISTTAGELLNCLAAIGQLLRLPPALLGLTVLAWGNSVGDLVADVAVAKAGQPAMAMAGCFAGPMFNMLFGLGTGLVIETVEVFPEAYELRFHTSIVMAFVFLILSLMGSLLVVTWHRFRVPRFWGFCLVALYVIFIAVSLVIAKISR